MQKSTHAKKNGKWINLFHSNFSPSGKQLEHRELAHGL